MPLKQKVRSIKSIERVKVRDLKDGDTVSRWDGENERFGQVEISSKEGDQPQYFFVWEGFKTPLSPDGTIGRFIFEESIITSVPIGSLEAGDEFWLPKGSRIRVVEKVTKKKVLTKEHARYWTKRRGFRPREFKPDDQVFSAHQ
jgi:hypothetical protein